MAGGDPPRSPACRRTGISHGILSRRPGRPRHSGRILGTVAAPDHVRARFAPREPVLTEHTPPQDPAPAQAAAAPSTPAVQAGAAPPPPAGAQTPPTAQVPPPFAATPGPGWSRWGRRRVPLAVAGVALLLGCLLGAGVTAAGALASAVWDRHGGHGGHGGPHGPGPRDGRDRGPGWRHGGPRSQDGPGNRPGPVAPPGPAAPQAPPTAAPPTALPPTAVPTATATSSPAPSAS